MVLRYGYRSRAAVNLTLCVSDTSAMKFECPLCFGIGWVCENHLKRAWSEDLGCQPCECTRVYGLAQGGHRSHLRRRFSEMSVTCRQ